MSDKEIEQALVDADLNAQHIIKNKKVYPQEAVSLAFDHLVIVKQQAEQIAELEQEIKELKDLLRLISNRIADAQTANCMARSVLLQSIVHRINEALGDE